MTVTYKRIRRGLVSSLAVFIAFTSAGIPGTLASAQQAPAKPGFVDVTASVSALMRGNELTVTATTTLAGQDPAHKRLKKLVVVYTAAGQEDMAAVMEGQTLKLAAPAGKALNLIRAFYGDLDFPVIDVTEQVRGAIRGDMVSMPVGVSLASGKDVAVGRPKSLRVSYGVGGWSHTITVNEGQKLNLPAPGDGTGRLSVASAVYGDLMADIHGAAFKNITAPAVAPRPVPADSQVPQALEVHLPRPALLTAPSAAVKFENRAGVYFADFGEASFGTLQIIFPGRVPKGTVTVRLGEKLDQAGAIDRNPPGSVNFMALQVATQPGKNTYQLQIPLKKGIQQGRDAIKEPPSTGNVTPFRYAEIEGSPVPLNADSVRQLSVHTAFDDSASSFHSSDETLNAVWDLCKHTVKATTAFGVYIDGERERRPYEADAYINLLSHLAVDMNPEVGRYSLEYLLVHKTWPTEWSFHMPMMAAAEYEATGDPSLAARNYEVLKAKLLTEKARGDGLLLADPIVDWPPGERDGYDIKPQANMAVNAFYYHSLKAMTLLAQALKKDDDARDFETKAGRVYDSINRVFFDPARGLYVDGEGSTHVSLHGNMFPLAFDLVPPERRRKVADFVQSRGMACSVYGAQYLLESMYKTGKDEYALQLLTSRGQRSWWNMIAVGSTMTTEAWDAKFKPNLTWNHSWGTAPANIISRFLLGVRPLAPGYGQILIAPRPGTLKSAEAKVPTPKGPVTVNFQNQARFLLEIEVPHGASARVSLPVRSGSPVERRQVWMDNKRAAATMEDDGLVVDNVLPGRHVFEAK